MYCTQKVAKSNLAHYCPVNLLSIINKVMERVFNSTHNLLTDAQFGFCQGCSAPDLITALLQTWTIALNSRGEVRVTALDINAAFEQV